MAITRFAFPTTIHFGPGARKLVGEHLRGQGVKRPLVVTDKGLAALPLIADLRDDLAAAGLDVAVFGGVFGNPTASQAMAGAAAYRAHRADAVVGVGGGAALDVAKVVGVIAPRAAKRSSTPTTIRACARSTPACRTSSRCRRRREPAAKVGRSAVISDDETHVKRIVFSAHILAKAVFADPELTLGLPPAVTAATGMDALTHNVESYLSPAYHPLCDGIALEGTRIAARALATAVREPGNLAARSDMMMSSMMGAIAFQKDLGAVHSCAHALGTVCDLHHGLANALMIDTVLAWNAGAVPAKFDELAHVVGVQGGARGFLAWLRDLKKTIGIAPNLSTVGVKKDAIPRLVEVAVADICHQTNPQPVTAKDFERLFAEAM
jgi:alcohol dehydrogenase class IV